MNRLVKVVVVSALASGFALCAPGVRSAQEPANGSLKVMREYKGVKLGLSRDQVHTALGKPETTSDNLEDYHLSGDDSLTVHFENGEVKAITISFLEAKNAPAMKEVVGETPEISQLENGATLARTNVTGEKFWVSYYKSKDGSTTRITISHQ